MHIYNMKIALMHELIKVMIILYSLMKIQKKIEGSWLYFIFIAKKIKRIKESP